MTTKKPAGAKALAVTPVTPEAIEESFMFEAWHLYGVDVAELDSFIRSGPLLDADRANAFQDRERASSLYAKGDLEHAMEVIRYLLMVRQIAEGVVPSARLGKKFTVGRKKGSAGPIRKLIARELKRSPSIKNPQLWDRICSVLPRGWAPFDNSIGKYLEGPTAGREVKYSSFCTIASEERGKLKR